MPVTIRDSYRRASSHGGLARMSDACGAHTWLHGEAPNLNQRADLALRWGVQHNDAGADDAQGAAQHPEDVELLIEHEMRQDCTAASHLSNP